MRSSQAKGREDQSSDYTGDQYAATDTIRP